MPVFPKSPWCYTIFRKVKLKSHKVKSTNKNTLAWWVEQDFWKNSITPAEFILIINCHYPKTCNCYYPDSSLWPLITNQCIYLTGGCVIDVMNGYRSYAYYCKFMGSLLSKHVVSLYLEAGTCLTFDTWIRVLLKFYIHLYNCVRHICVFQI